MTDMADIKKTTNSSNTSNKYVNRFNVGGNRMTIEVKAGVRSSNKAPRAIGLDKMIKVSFTSSTHDDRELETNRGKDLGVDD
jgi:hypothetical protein